MAMNKDSFPNDSEKTDEIKTESEISFFTRSGSSPTTQNESSSQSTAAPALKIRTINCAIQGCNSKYEITAPFSKVRYVCSHHGRKDQLAAAGRVFDADNDEKDIVVRFQNHQFDRSLRRSTTPLGTSHVQRQGRPTGEGDESTELLLNKVAQSLPKRFRVQTATNYEGPRPETPDWLKTRDLISFIINRLNEEERHNLLHHKIARWAAVDYVILVEYYLRYTTDEEIFEKYNSHLQAEAEGKRRWTSSVNALKNRRLRLVKEGDAMFGKKWSPLKGHWSSSDDAVEFVTVSH
jgi:hypothetical protein